MKQNRTTHPEPAPQDGCPACRQLSVARPGASLRQSANHLGCKGLVCAGGCWRRVGECVGVLRYLVRRAERLTTAIPGSSAASFAPVGSFTGRQQPEALLHNRACQAYLTHTV